MTKQAGLGDQLYVSGNDLSGDVGSIQRAGQSRPTTVVTGINKSAQERLHLHRNGLITFQAFFNKDTGQAHPVLSALPTADRIVSYFRGAAVGNPAASMVGKQIGYDPNRNRDGSLTVGVSAQSNGFGLDWGKQLTAGIDTDETAAAQGAAVDFDASTDFGVVAYLHVFAFTGTDATVKLQASADGSTGWADVTGGGFTEISTLGGAGTSERIQTARDLTVARYLRWAITTSAGFSALEFAVAASKPETEKLY